MADKEIKMTREEKLWSMTAKTLQEVGEKAGVKITNSDIKKGKAVIIEKILAAEAKVKESKVIEPEKIETKEEFLTAVSDILDGKATVKEPVKPIEASEKTKTDKTTKVPKKANLKLNELTHNGQTKSIKEWAAEKNIPWPTLYDRVNRNNWPIDLAIETPLGQRRPKK